MTEKTKPDKPADAVWKRAQSTIRERIIALRLCQEAEKMEEAK